VCNTVYRLPKPYIVLAREGNSRIEREGKRSVEVGGGSGKKILEERLESSEI
jgi:hypothetical protein